MPKYRPFAAAALPSVPTASAGPASDTTPARARTPAVTRDRARLVQAGRCGRAEMPSGDI
ncbi:hypothetical protein GCM10010518_01060 [Kitasatospora cinereorecta]